jgi:hypothetical protein
MLVIKASDKEMLHTPSHSFIAYDSKKNCVLDSIGVLTYSIALFVLTII